MACIMQLPDKLVEDVENCLEDKDHNYTKLENIIIDCNNWQSD